MTARQQIARLLPLVLLVILVAAGLRGEVLAPRWNGPLKSDGAAIGLALEVILGALLAVTRPPGRRGQARGAAAAVHRRARPTSSPPRRSGSRSSGCSALCMVGGRGGPDHRSPPALLRPGQAADAAAVRPRKLKPPTAADRPRGRLDAAHPVRPDPLRAARRRAGGGGRDQHLVVDSRLRTPAAPLVIEDVEHRGTAGGGGSGRAALAEIDDARAAIIACYVAMERSLAERGTRRSARPTRPTSCSPGPSPRASSGAGAASRLTALFYEARFSTHPLAAGQRAAASAALDELAGELARPSRQPPAEQPAGGQPSRESPRRQPQPASPGRWRAAVPELIIAAIMVVAAALAGAAVSGWPGVVVVAAATTVLALLVLRGTIPRSAAQAPRAGEGQAAGAVDLRLRAAPVRRRDQPQQPRDVRVGPAPGPRAHPRRPAGRWPRRQPLHRAGRRRGRRSAARAPTRPCGPGSTRRKRSTPTTAHRRAAGIPRRTLARLITRLEQL